MLPSTGLTVNVSVPSGTSDNPMPSVYTLPLAEKLVGVVLESSALPPLTENVKSEASRLPVPKGVL